MFGCEFLIYVDVCSRVRLEVTSSSLLLGFLFLFLSFNRSNEIKMPLFFWVLGFGFGSSISFLFLHFFPFNAVWVSLFFQVGIYLFLDCCFHGSQFIVWCAYCHLFIWLNYKFIYILLWTMIGFLFFSFFAWILSLRFYDCFRFYCILEGLLTLSLMMMMMVLLLGNELVIAVGINLV